MLIKKPFKKGFGFSSAPYYKSAGGGSSYTGPGDIVSGAALWGSPARAYSAAFAAGGTAIMDLVDQAGANPITINILTTGFADLTAISNWVTSHTVTTINVTKLYDQTGNARHFTQATLANMPVLTLSALGGLPGLTFNAGSGQINAAALTLTGPYSISGVYKRVGTAEGGVLAVQTTLLQLFAPPATADTLDVGLGAGNATQTATDGSFHAAAGILDNITPVAQVIVDGSAGSTTNAGSNAISSGVLRIGRSSGGATLVGTIMEAGLWATLAFNATQYGNLNTNQHSLANGYNF